MPPFLAVRGWLVASTGPSAPGSGRLRDGNPDWQTRMQECDVQPYERQAVNAIVVDSHDRKEAESRTPRSDLEAGSASLI